MICSSRTTSYLQRIALLTLLYVVSGQVSLWAAVSNDAIHVMIFAAEGFGLAYAIRWGWTMWPGVFVGQLLLGLISGHSLLIALGSGTINGLEMIIAALLFRRCGLHHSLDRLKDILLLFGIVWLVLQPLSAAATTAILLHTHAIPETLHVQAWFAAWFSNSIGQMLVTPLILALWSECPVRKQRIPCLLVGLGICVVSVAVFWYSPMMRVGLIFIPLLTLVALWGGMGITTLSNAVVAANALAVAASGHGSFTVNGAPDLLSLGMFLFATALTSECIAALFTERRRLMAEVQHYLGMIDKHVITSSTDHTGIIQSVSQAFCDISGYTREELIGQAHNIIRHADMPKAFYRDMWDTLLSGQPWSGELKNRRKDSSAYWVAVDIGPRRNSDGHIEGFTAIRQDITGKKEVEALSAEREQLLAEIQQHVDIIDKYVILSLTDSHGNIQSVSQAFCDVSGYSKEELAGQPYRILYHPDTPSSLYDDLWNTITSGKPWIGEVKNRCKDGGAYWAIAHIVPRWDAAGEIEGFTTIRYDVTDKKRIEALLAERQGLLDQIQSYVETMDKYVISSSTNRKGIIQSVSQAFCNISGYTREELIGQRHNIVRHPEMPKELYKDLWQTILSGKPWKGELKNRRKDGSAYWVEVNIEPNDTEGGKVKGFTAIRHDITDKKYIEHLSITDGLTQLNNRMRMDEVLLQEEKRAERYGHAVSIILFDVDHFKIVNDTHGHPVGDDVLVRMACLLKDTLRAIDIPGRWGGEEFLVVCPETPLEGAACVAEKLRSTVAGYHFPVVEHKTCSFGVAARMAGETVEHLVQRADVALYRAKQTGRNRVEIAT